MINSNVVSNKAKLVPKNRDFFLGGNWDQHQPGAVMAAGHFNVIILHQAAET